MGPDEPSPNAPQRDMNNANIMYLLNKLCKLCNFCANIWQLLAILPYYSLVKEAGLEPARLRHSCPGTLFV